MAVTRFKNEEAPFKWKHFKGGPILWLVRWSCRYALSYADLKVMAAERGLSVERSTLCRGVHECAPEINKRMKPPLKQTGDFWRADETYVKIKGKWHYLYRSIDKEGQALDWMLSRHRNKQVATRYFKKALSNNHVVHPCVINVDKNPEFIPAHKALQGEKLISLKFKLRQVTYLNNGIESDHKSTKRKSCYRQWYQSFDTAARTIDGMEAMRMLQKGQIKYVAKGSVCAQSDFINGLFGIAA